ncbi:MAG: HyaD/HybD family hydrogenase maturation endopeptidase [Candidatus Omnitrophica bacterium]|nr:HyaD/HybD family hydrogenase maturation endopeptidase [Candidatus Omnitrophota bacterium]
MRLIIGCGNLLLKDEGVGVHLIEYLKDKELPEDVELIDGGTAGFDLIDFILGKEKVVIIDSVKAGGNPGDIYCFSPSDFETDNPPKTSLHDITLKDIFSIVQRQDNLVEIKIIGIEPKDISYGTELSPELKNLLPKIAEIVLKEVNA